MKLIKMKKVDAGDKTLLQENGIELNRYDALDGKMELSWVIRLEVPTGYILNENSAYRVWKKLDEAAKSLKKSFAIARNQK